MWEFQQWLFSLIVGYTTLLYSMLTFDSSPLNVALFNLQLELGFVSCGRTTDWSGPLILWDVNKGMMQGA